MAPLDVPGAMLIVTRHAREQAEENFRWLADRLGVALHRMVMRSFEIPVRPGDSRPQELAVVGFMVAQRALPASAQGQ